MKPLEGTLTVDPSIVAMHASAAKAKQTASELVDKLHKMDAEAERKRKQEEGDDGDDKSSSEKEKRVESDEEPAAKPNRFASMAASSGVARVGTDEILDTPKDKVMQPASWTVDTVDSDGMNSGDDSNIPTDIVRPFVESLASAYETP